MLSRDRTVLLGLRIIDAREIPYLRLCGGY
jgi:hypothetical protein